jgi:hypothetical protein
MMAWSADLMHFGRDRSGKHDDGMLLGRVVPGSARVMLRATGSKVSLFWASRLKPLGDKMELTASFSWLVVGWK